MVESTLFWVNISSQCQVQISRLTIQAGYLQHSISISYLLDFTEERDLIYLSHNQELDKTACRRAKYVYNLNRGTP